MRPDGSQPSSTLKTKISTMPSQKLGVAMPSTAIVPAARSRKRPRLSAATTPSGIPTSMASSIAQGMIASVFGRRERNTSTAGWRIRSDVPRSPCNALPMNATYCVKSEPSRPIASIRCARSSAVASSGSIRSTGLPENRPRKNTTVATRTRSKRPCNSRRAIKPPIGGILRAAPPARRSASRALPQSFLPRLLVGLRNTLEHVTELVPARDGRELADLLGIDRIVAHPLDDRHDNPMVGDELDHAVIQCRPLARVALVDHRLVDVDELLAGLRAVVLVAEHPLGAVRREGRVVAPGRIGPAGSAVHRGPARQIGLLAHLHRRECAPLVVLHGHLDADLGPHVGDGGAGADHELRAGQSHIGELELEAVRISFLRQYLSGEGRIVPVGLVGPLLPALYAQVFGEAEGRERPRYLRLARHHMLDDLLAIDGEGQGLPHPWFGDRIVLHGGAPGAIELEHGLHGAGNGQHLEPSTAGAEHRFRADRGDRGLAGAHHGDARAL